MVNLPTSFLSSPPPPPYTLIGYTVWPLQMSSLRLISHVKNEVVGPGDLWVAPHLLIFFESKTGSSGRAHVVLLHRTFHPSQLEGVILPGKIKLIRQLESTAQVMFLSCIKLLLTDLWVGDSWTTVVRKEKIRPRQKTKQNSGSMAETRLA